MEKIKKIVQWLIWLIEPETLTVDSFSPAPKPGLAGFIKKKTASKTGDGGSLSEETGFMSFLFKPERLETESVIPQTTGTGRDPESFISYLLKPETLPLSEPSGEKKEGFFSWLLKSEDLPDESNKKV